MRLTTILCIGLLLVSVGIMGAARLSPGDCSTLEIDSASDELWIETRGSRLQANLEPDMDGSQVGVTVDLYACTAEDTDTCAVFQWDSDDDGVRDTNEFDGVTAGKRGHMDIRIAGYAYFDVTAVSAGGATSVLKVCATR